MSSQTGGCMVGSSQGKKYMARLRQREQGLISPRGAVTLSHGWRPSHRGTNLSSFLEEARVGAWGG